MLKPVASLEISNKQDSTKSVRALYVGDELRCQIRAQTNPEMTVEAPDFCREFVAGFRMGAFLAQQFAVCDGENPNSCAWNECKSYWVDEDIYDAFQFADRVLHASLSTTRAWLHTLLKFDRVREVVESPDCGVGTARQGRKPDKRLVVILSTAVLDGKDVLTQVDAYWCNIRVIQVRRIHAPDKPTVTGAWPAKVEGFWHGVSFTTGTEPAVVITAVRRGSDNILSADRLEIELRRLPDAQELYMPVSPTLAVLPYSGSVQIWRY